MSEAIDDIAYDEDTKEMRVVFTTGRTYIYFDVPADAFEAFASAESLGRHFNAHVRDAYDWSEVR